MSANDPKRTSASFPSPHGRQSVRAVEDGSAGVTVPVLCDEATNTIVNNESSEIIRMFNSAFDACGAAPGDFCPKELRREIDGWNTAGA
jgi:glutathionyl-hydroquinone reductase